MAKAVQTGPPCDLVKKTFGKAALAGASKEPCWVEHMICYAGWRILDQQTDHFCCQGDQKAHLRQQHQHQAALRQYVKKW